MMSMMEYVRRTDETIVEGKIDVYFQDAELFGELVDRAEYQRRLAVELAPRTDTAVGRFINSRGQGAKVT
ncbi:hypothetical protein ABID62_009790 [Bradyrhizobium sp. S3.9.1]|jgi:hypothetical protein